MEIRLTLSHFAHVTGEPVMPGRVSDSTSARALLSEDEVHEWIVTEMNRTSSCRDLDLRFMIVRRFPRNETGPSWDLRAVSGWSTWSPVCRDALNEAVRKAQARFDLL
jgi:hypothetical protein